MAATRPAAAAFCLLIAHLAPLQAQPPSPASGPAAQAAAAPGPTRLRVVGGMEALGPYINHELPFWTKELPARSKGRVQAEIVPFDRVGIRAQDALRLIQLGIVPFGTILLSQVAAQAPELSAPDLTGLSRDIAGLKRAVAAFRPLLQKTLREQYGVELLAVYAYPAQVLFCKRPLARLSDLKGRKVRTSTASQSDLVEALGSIPVRTAFGQIMSYMRSSSIDCAIAGTMAGNAIGLHEATTDLYPLPLGWGLSVFAAHAPSWNALHRDVQVLLRQAPERLSQDQRFLGPLRTLLPALAGDGQEVLLQRGAIHQVSPINGSAGCRRTSTARWRRWGSSPARPRGGRPHR